MLHSFPQFLLGYSACKLDVAPRYPKRVRRTRPSNLKTISQAAKRCQNPDDGAECDPCRAQPELPGRNWGMSIAKRLSQLGPTCFILALRLGDNAGTVAVFIYLPSAVWHGYDDVHCLAAYSPDGPQSPRCGLGSRLYSLHANTFKAPFLAHYKCSEFRFPRLGL